MSCLSCLPGETVTEEC
uniref:Uncharacterized protein n=1 Tax=Anguilla anguilla TaxID=7936 RepID=A0A0E9X9G0_ANGAN